MSQQWSIKAVRTITLKIELKEEYVNSTTGLKYVVGHSVREYFMNRYAGVNPANGDALWYTADGELTTEFREEDKVMTGKSFDSPWVGGGRGFHCRRNSAGWQNDM